MLNRIRHACLALLLPFLLPAAPPTITDAGDRIIARTPAYEVSVARSPYRLSVSVGGKTILAHQGAAVSGGSRFEVEGASYKLARVAEWRGQVDGLYLELETEPAGYQIPVSLSFAEKSIHVTWRLPHDRKATVIGESFALDSGGHWYGGDVTLGHVWPLESGSVERDPFLSDSNQTTPLWLASSGGGVFMKTYQPLGFSINRNGDGLLRVHRRNSSVVEYDILAGANIVEGYRAFIDLAGKPSVVPPREYFAEPIFNTWIEFGTAVTQKDVEDYAHKVKDSGFPSTILMVDDGWATHYGDHTFNPEKFPNPKAMMDELHRLGFKLIIWVVPFIEKDAVNYGIALEKGYLVMAPGGKEPAMARWWNGLAAMVDLSNPAAYQWFLEELISLQRNYGVDGFKLDAGDAKFLPEDAVSFGNMTTNQYTDLYARLGRHFAVNEYRVSWLAQPWGLVQRLRDKSSTWNLHDGLGAVVPHGLTESLIGYPYFCPDIIGGGLDASFKDPNFKGIDEELFVRWTQASALMPMMQFSYAPWRIKPEAEKIALKYSRLHLDLAGYIYTLAHRASVDGTPIVQPLFFRNPEDENTYAIRDQFLLGDRFLVAPVLTKGATARDVYLPAGLWKDFWSEKIYEGGQTLTAYPAPLEKLPIFIALDQ